MSLKTVFFGSPGEAVQALVKTLEAGHRVDAVFTRPDRRAGRSRQPRPTAVRVAAESRGLRVETPRSLRDEDTQALLAALDADLFIVVAYGRILPPEVLAIPRLGALNIHPSLLPLHRGPSPVATAIREGDEQTGVSLMLLDEGMDSGPILRRSDPVRLDGTERAGELTARLFEVGSEMLPGTLTALENGEIQAMPQDESLVTVTRLLEKDDGRIDWAQDAVSIERMTRAYDPWPGTFTLLRGKALKVVSVLPATGGSDGVPGTVMVRERRLYVATGSVDLELARVQPEGRRQMAGQDLVNGMPDLAGTVLGR